ncbi:MAG: tetratricopeptide repeat protein [PVC group bacterium]
MIFIFNKYKIVYSAALVIVAGCIVYANSFSGAFIFDDEAVILANPHIKQLWPPREACAAPPDSPVRDRPIVSLTLSINYVLTGSAPFGYHAANLLIHLAAALFLFGIIRRTFLSPRLPSRCRSAATGLALASALIWTVHPLQTQSVTYLTQRCESLMGLFYLGTIYGLIRGAASSRSRFWYGFSVLLCALGMGTKAVMVTAPLVALVYDRVFIASSWNEIRRNRWSLYLALFLTWTIQAALVAATSYRDIRTHQPMVYALSQFKVIAYYLRLAVFPRPLCLDYHWPPARTAAEIIPAALAIAALLALTVRGLQKAPPLGFAGLWFFLILAPTSSVLPLEDIAFEHRMYLPLAAPVVLGVLGGWELARRLFPGSPARRRRWGIGLTLLAVAGLGTLTVLRNRDYRSAAAMWEDVIARRPANPRAYNSLGNIVLKDGDTDRAFQLYRRAAAVDPGYQAAHYNLANLLAAQGDLDGAVAHYLKTLEINPKAVEAHNNLGVVLYGRGEADQARAHFLEAMKIDPEDAAAYYNLGLVFLREGLPREAVRYLDRASALRPDHLPARRALAAARERLSNP